MRSRIKFCLRFQAIAEMTTCSEWLVRIRLCLICYNIGMVIGSLMQDVAPLSILILLIPVWTHLRSGIDDPSHGSGRPRESWVFLTAAKYVCGDRPSSAS